MKNFAIVLLALLSSSCAYHYNIGVQKDAPPMAAATLVSDFSFDIVEIDGEKFKEKFNFSAIGTNTIALSPGIHMVKFKYCDCSLNYQVWTEGYNYVAKHMEAGKKYRMMVIKAGEGKVRFDILEIVK